MASYEKKFSNRKYLKFVFMATQLIHSNGVTSHTPFSRATGVVSIFIVPNNTRLLSFFIFNLHDECLSSTSE
jgi:hypothetical protein